MVDNEQQRAHCEGGCWLIGPGPRRLTYSGRGLSIPTSLSNHPGTDSREVLVHLVHQGVQVPDGFQRLAVLLAVHSTLLPQAGDLWGKHRVAPYLRSQAQAKGAFPFWPLPTLQLESLVKVYSGAHALFRTLRTAKATRTSRASTIMLHHQPCRKSLVAVRVCTTAQGV